MGCNTRTGKEGIFPKSYVQPESEPTTTSQPNWNDEKKGASTSSVDATAPSGGGSYPAPPGRVDPYNSSAPPMSMANGEGGPPSKTEENTKKFGKKLGNAAIFGAGATIGGKIVNSIF